MRLSLRRASFTAGLFALALAISSWCHAAASKSCEAGECAAGMTPAAACPMGDACPMRAECAACAQAAGPAQTVPRASLRPVTADAAIAAITPAPEPPPAALMIARTSAPRLAVGRPIYLVVRSLRL